MLTVPQATTVAGRAANVGQQPQLQIGQAAAELGGRVFDLASQMIASRIQQRTQVAQLDMTTDFAAARLKVDQLTDPAEVGPAWDQETAAIRARYLPTDDKGNVTLDPREADALSLYFKDLSGQHTTAIAGNVATLGRSQQKASWLATSNRIGAQAQTADPQTAEALVALSDQRIAQLEADGVMTAPEAELARQQATAGIWGAQASKLIDSDPQAFLDQAGEGLWNQKLGADGLAQGQAAAQAAVAQKAKAAEDAAARDARQQAALANDQLDAMIGLSAKGVSPAQRALLTDPTFRAAADPAKLARAEASVKLVDEIPTIGQMSVPDLKAAIAAETAKPKTAGWQTEKLDLMQSQLNARQAALTKDGAAYLQAQGTGFAKLPSMDPADPAFAAAIRGRVVDAQHYSGTEGVSVQPFTTEEQAQIKALADPSVDPKARAQLASVLGAELGYQAASSLTGNPVFGQVSGLLASGAPTALGAEILKGQARMAADNVVKPPVKERLQSIFTTLGPLLGDTIGEAEAASKFAAADALYAARFPDPAAAFDPDGYGQALHEVLGGQGPYKNAEARGGMQDVNGAMTLMPQGLRAQEVEAGLASVAQFEPDVFKSLMTMISVSGAPPMINGLPIPASDLEGVRIEAVADDTYRFVTEGGTTFEDGTGAPYEFHLLGSGAAHGLLGVITP
jgi:hypothetical protein